MPIKVSNPGDLALLLGRGKKDTITDKRGKVKTLAPAPTPHGLGTETGLAEVSRLPYDSKDEEIYGDILEGRRRRGMILGHEFQLEKFRLGEGSWYTPDFRVIEADRLITFIEVKGGVIREAARVRFLVAADLHPYRFAMIYHEPKKKGGGWRLIHDTHPERGGYP